MVKVGILKKLLFYSILKIIYEKSEINFDWMLYNYQVNNNIEKIIILGEYNEYSHNKNAKIELITTKNDKIDSDNKKIDSIRSNKHKSTDTQKTIPKTNQLFFI